MQSNYFVKRYCFSTNPSLDTNTLMKALITIVRRCEKAFLGNPDDTWFNKLVATTLVCRINLSCSLKATQHGLFSAIIQRVQHSSCRKLVLELL